MTSNMLNYVKRNVTIADAEMPNQQYRLVSLIADFLHCEEGLGDSPFDPEVRELAEGYECSKLYSESLWEAFDEGCEIALSDRWCG